MRANREGCLRQDLPEMVAPTVELIGLTDLAKIPEFLRLGVVVIVAPDLDVLRHWREEHRPASGLGPARSHPPGLDIDADGRRVLWDGEVVALTDLEFRVFSRLASTPGRAWSFSDLRAAGWGEEPGSGIDAYAVRSVIQRIRRKLATMSDQVLVESVRGYGFRFVDDPHASTRPWPMSQPVDDEAG